MASFRKRNGKWQARIQRKHSPSISQSFYELDTAKKWVRKIEREIDLGLILLKPSKTPFSYLLIRYQKEILPLKVRIDVVYVRNKSFLYDLLIVMKTCLIIFNRIVGKKNFKLPKEYYLAKKI